MREHAVRREEDQRIEAPPRPVAPSAPVAILALQRGAGNAAVARALLQRELQTVGAVTLDLAGGDVALAGVLAKLMESGWTYQQLRELVQEVQPAATPERGALHDAERAEMTLQFLHRGGGTIELVRYAGRQPLGTNDAYLALLKLLLGVKRLAPGLTGWRLDALVADADALADSDERLKSALYVVGRADDRAAADRMLAALRGFSWQLARLQTAIDDALRVAGDERAEENAALDQEKQQREAAARAAQAEPALSQLNRRDKEALKSGSPGTTKYDDAKKKRDAKQAELAKPDLDAIALDIQTRRQALPPLHETEAFTDRRDAWLTYYEAVGYDTRAQTALDLAAGSFARATPLLQAARADARVSAWVFDSKPEVKVIDAALALPLVELGALLALAPADFTRFAVKPTWLGLLRALNAGNVPANKVADVAQRLGALTAYAGTATEVTALVALLGPFTMAQVDALLAAMHPAGQAQAGKLAALEAVRVHAAGYAEVLSSAQMAERVHCTPAELQLAVAGLGGGLAAGALADAIHRHVRGRNAKVGEFKQWIADVGMLVAVNYYTVTFTAPQPLPGNSTIENVGTVWRNGTFVDTFVVHRHPGVGQGAVGAANQSGLHTKPVRGNLQTEREPVDNLPVTLRQQIKATGI